MTLIAVNPADGTELARYQNTQAEQVTQAIDRAQSAFLAWRVRPIAERCELLRSLASTLRENITDLALRPLAPSEVRVALRALGWW